MPHSSWVPPRLWIVTDFAEANPPWTLRTLGEAVLAAHESSGVSCAVVVRDKSLSLQERVAMGESLKRVGCPWGVTLDDPAQAPRFAGATFAWLSQVGARRLAESQVLDLPFGVSCHDLGEVDAADALGAGAAVCSPVAESISKSGWGANPTTREAARALLRDDRLSTVALGGVSAPIVPSLLRAGAYGVAVMGAVMRSRHPNITMLTSSVRKGDAEFTK